MSVLGVCLCICSVHTEEEQGLLSSVHSFAQGADFFFLLLIVLPENKQKKERPEIS